MTKRPNVLAWLLCLCCAGGAWGVTRKDDLAGEWRIVSAKVGEREMPDLKDARLRFEGGRKVLTLAGGGQETGYYTFDSSRRPKEIETTTDGKPGIQKGIYTVLGKQLTLCLSQSGRVRPKRFTTRGNEDLILVVLARASTTVAGRKAAASGAAAGPARTFRMGFTGLVYDMTVEAVTETRRFCRENGDLIAHNIEGVPWAEALAGGPYRADLMEEWRGKKDGTPPNGKVLVSLSPGRGELKKADKSAPIPAVLLGKSYNDRSVKKAYLAYCRQTVEFFKPDYLCIGIEANEIYKAGRDKWRAYVDLHRHVYTQLKRDHPRLPIFASFNLHNLFKERGGMQGEFQKLMPFNDMVAINYYPFLVPAANRLKALNWAMSVFDRYRKPYAFVQTGDAAQTVRLPQSGLVIAGNPAQQAAYFEALLSLARKRRFAFVVNFVGRDYDELWVRLGAQAPEFFMIFRDCGLVDGDGVERPAFTVWKRYFAMPLREGKRR